MNTNTKTMGKNNWRRLGRSVMLAAALFAALPARAQQNYVFYNGTYGYLYNDNGTLKSSATLQYDKSSVWVASGAIGTSSRTIQSYTDNQYLGNAGSLSGTTANWRGYNNYLAYRSGGTNYYLKATSATAFTTNSNANNGQRYYYYTVSLTDYPEQLSDISINSGVDAITATGNYAYGHTNTNYRPAYVNYYFSNTNHYVLSDNTQNGTTAPATTAVNTGYTWSLSNADGYATVNSATGEITVSTLPDVDREMVLTCSVSSHGLTKTATKNIELRGTHPIEPTITRSGNDITIATPSNGATIYYTLDGTEPTASSNVYTAPFNVFGETYPLTIKAVAIRTGNSSNVASVTYTTQGSGVGGGNVILNDLEDHSWSYYGDSDCPIHSLNPADVKITYYGDGIVMSNNNDYTAGTSNYVSPGDANYVGGAKVNVGGEDENTFIYYKTLERENADGSGRCPYTPIYNPFQVRPTYGTRGGTDANDFTGWRGFQCWRLKSVSGGAVYNVASGGTALSTGAVINAETPIYLAPAAEYGMEMELEAVWAIAYVTKANQANENPVGTNNVGYERNFCVPTTGAGYTLYVGTGKRITNANHIPVTISCYYPDGTAPNNTNNSISNTAFALTADTKFENIPISLTSNTLTLDNYDIIVGRGCTGTVNNLQGINAGATDLDYSIRIESGTYNQFCFVRDGTNTTVSGRYLIKAIMGSDYDRATGTNNKLIVSPNSTLFLARTVGFTGSSNKDQKTFDCVFKSGTYQSGYWNGTDQSGQNAYLNIAYLGQNSAQGNTYPGVRCVTVEGGEFGGMCGGRGVSSNSNNSTYVTPEVIAFDLRIKGGTFHGSVFGGAADNPSIGSRRFIITGGTIQSWLAGGCNGTGSQTGTGATDGDSYIYVGGTALVGGNTTITINDTPGGQIFGAGRGVSGRLSSVNHSHVVVADEATVSNASGDGGFVYGGSYNGNIADVSNVYITGGTVEGKVFGGSYGNGNSGAIPVANIIMTGGHVTKGVYGGSNSNGNVGDVTMHIDGGTVGNSTAEDGVYGGGYGASTSVTGDVSVTLGASTSATDSATVNGNVYGGSALGSVNTNASNTTVVTMNKALVNGNIFGGAYGNGATVTGRITVNVNGGRVNGNVFGGGDAAAYSHGGDFPVVNMTGGQVTNIFGGGKGNTATVTGNPQVTLSGNAHVTGNVYGGGDAAPVTGQTNVQLHD